MNDWDKIALAFDMLETAEVLHEFDDSVTLRIDGELWRDFVMFHKQEQCDHTFERDEMMINVCTKCGIEGEQD